MWRNYSPRVVDGKLTQPINQWIPMRCPYGTVVWEDVVDAKGLVTNYKSRIVMCTIVYPHGKHRNGDTTWT